MMLMMMASMTMRPIVNSGEKRPSPPVNEPSLWNDHDDDGDDDGLYRHGDDNDNKTQCQ